MLEDELSKAEQVNKAVAQQLADKEAAVNSATQDAVRARRELEEAKSAYLKAVEVQYVCVSASMYLSVCVFVFMHVCQA